MRKYSLSLIWNGSIYFMYLDSVNTVNISDTNPLIGQPYDILLLRESDLYSFNGSIDEVMIYNRSLSASEINDTFHNRSARFYINGTLKLNGSYDFGNHSAVNITLHDCQENFGTFLSAETDNGTHRDFDSNCRANNVTISTINATNITLILNADPPEAFYTPLIIGNITLDSYCDGGICLSLEVTPPDNVSPIINWVADNPDPVYITDTINFTANVTDANSSISTVWFMLDNGTNYTMTNGTDNRYYHEFDTTGLVIATYNYTVNANDTASIGAQKIRNIHHTQHDRNKRNHHAARRKLYIRNILDARRRSNQHTRQLDIHYRRRNNLDNVHTTNTSTTKQHFRNNSQRNSIPQRSRWKRHTHIPTLIHKGGG